MTFLRPSRIVISGERVWLLDGARPAAAVVGRDDTIALCEWTVDDESDDDYHDRRRVVAVDADRGGVVVQDGDRLTWLHEDDPATSVSAADDLELVAADGAHAWLVDGGCPPFDDEDDDDEDDDDGSGLIVMLSRDGTTHTVRTERPVARVLLTPGSDGVEIRFAEQPTVTPFGDGLGGGAVAYPESRARVDRAVLLATDTLVVEPEYLAETAVAAIDLLDIEDDLRWAWLETEPGKVLAGGEPLGEDVWWFGADTEGSAIDRQVLVVAHDPATGIPRRTLTAGEGTVETVARVRDELWFVVNRMQFLRVGRDDGIEVLALAADGTIRTVLAPDSVIIRSHEAALVPRPGDDEIAAHVAQSRDVFGDLEHFWRDRAGRAHPLSTGLQDLGPVVEGEWPHVELLVRLRHPVRPGLVLQRRFRLYDRRGRAVGLDDATIEIMEDLDTSYLPPAANAVHGVLEF